MTPPVTSTTVTACSAGLSPTPTTGNEPKPSVLCPYTNMSHHKEFIRAYNDESPIRAIRITCSVSCWRCQAARRRGACNRFSVHPLPNSTDAFEGCSLSCSSNFAPASIPCSCHDASEFARQMRHSQRTSCTTTLDTTNRYFLSGWLGGCGTLREPLVQF